MIPSAIVFALLGSAVASPLAVRKSNPELPQTATSKGFNLVVSVDDPASDFSPSIQHSFISSIHTGAGSALVGVIDDISRSRLFYQNGTAKQEAGGQATIITDGGTPATPSGLKLNKDKGSKTLSTASLDFGPGTPGVQLSTSSKSYVSLLPETYLACKEKLAYYQGKEFVILKQLAKKEKVPKNCISVHLIPQCAKLETLPKGSYSSHKYALESKCYKDASKIDWSKYRS